jgi:hypothetical protein
MRQLQLKTSSEPRQVEESLSPVLGQIWTLTATGGKAHKVAIVVLQTGALAATGSRAHRVSFPPPTLPPLRREKRKEDMRKEKKKGNMRRLR